jgi:phosphodiesterase/alkaline phosphatase D-like protein
MQESKNAFMNGYKEMVKKIDPEIVVCYGDRFPEMDGLAQLIEIEYSANTTISYEENR